VAGRFHRPRGGRRLLRRRSWTGECSA
jgi:hypothetical protein